MIYTGPNEYEESQYSFKNRQVRAKFSSNLIGLNLKNYAEN